MNCEQVEERLSAYLDNMLTSDERRDATIHLQTCPRCMTLLAELRQYDILLAQLPRVGPSSAVRERLFAIPEVQELSEALSYPSRAGAPVESTQPLAPFSRPLLDAREPLSHPHPISLPGGHSARTQLQPRETDIPPTPPTVRLQPASLSYPTQQFRPVRTHKPWFTPLKIALAVALIAMFGTAGLLSLSLRHQPGKTNLADAITPPAGPLTGQIIPLAAGSRFVFLRDGALWSTLADVSDRQPERLTPANETVASGWVVNPLQGNHDAGDLVAYIDIQSRQVHTIRSDGQQDIPIQLSLLPKNNAADWQSNVGQVILNSLAWSPDSSKLVFAADPTGSGQTGLYLSTPGAGSARQIASSLKGNLAHPVWSPDGTRLAFTLTHNGVVSIQDFNVQSRSVLDLSNLTAARGNSADGVLTLNWFSNAGQMAVTWCLGSIGHISSVWVHPVGNNGTIYPQQLSSGIYVQALYNPGSDNETGGWLLVASVAGQSSDIWRLHPTAGSQLVPLSQNKQVSLARWSPDGSSVFYLDGVVNGVGRGHLVNVVTGVDQLLPDHIAVSPAPAWSADGLQLAYSTGTQIDIVHTLNSGQFTHLHLVGQITNFSWSPSAIHQLVVSLGSPVAGLYLVDTQQNTSHQLDHVGADSLIQWTEIP